MSDYECCSPYFSISQNWRPAMVIGVLKALMHSWLVSHIHMNSMLSSIEGIIDSWLVSHIHIAQEQEHTSSGNSFTTNCYGIAFNIIM